MNPFLQYVHVSSGLIFVFSTPFKKAMTTTQKIPGPAALPVLGNAWNIDQSYPLGSLQQLAEKYGL
jgi:hypothetical protein